MRPRTRLETLRLATSPVMKAIVDALWRDPADLSKLNPFTVTEDRVTIDRDLHITGNITATKEIAAWMAGTVTSEVLDALSVSQPLQKTGTNIQLNVNATQFEVNAANELQIKANVLAPALHNHAIADITGLQSSLDAKANLNSPAFSGTPTVPTPGTLDNSTQIANTAFVRAVVAALVDSSPASLDTLNELATALGNDPNFATTMVNSLASKAPINSPVFTGTVQGITKAMVGLGNVDNTSDANKPISTAVSTALGLKVDKVAGKSLVSDTDISKLAAFTVEAGKVTIDRDLHVAGNITASKEVAAWVAGAVTSDVLSSLSVIGPLYKPSSSSVGLAYNVNQFEVNGYQELQIKAGILAPAAHSHAISDVTGLQLALDGKAPVSGSSNYIQASPASAQSANMWISGEVKSPIFRGSHGYWGNAIIGGNGSLADLALLGSDDNYIMYVPTGSKNTSWVGSAYFAGSINAPTYKLNNNDLFGSLSNNYLPKWDGGKFVNTNLYQKDGDYPTVGNGDYMGINFANSLGTVKTLIYQHAYYDAIIFKDQVNNADRYIFKNNGEAIFTSTTPSTSPTTGALTVAGGLGVGGRINAGDRLTITPPLNNSDYGIFVAGASGGANRIALFGQFGVTNGFTVDYNGSEMVYNMYGGNLNVFGNGYFSNEVISVGNNHGFRVNSTVGDNVNASPWFGLGYSNVTGGLGGNKVQLAGYCGMLFRTAAGNTSMEYNGDWIFDGYITAPKAKLQSFELKNASGSTLWTIELSGTDVIFKNTDGVKKMKLEQTGNLHAAGELTAYSTQVNS